MSKLINYFFIFLILIIVPLTACSKAADDSAEEKAENAAEALNETEAGNEAQEQINATAQAEANAEQPAQAAPVQEEQPETTEAPKQEEVVRIIGVSGDSKSCIISIKGQTTVIDEGKSATIQGVTVRVTEVVATHSISGASDQCKISIS